LTFEELVTSLKTLDWFFITIFIGIVIFFASFIFIMYKIKKNKPSILKPEKITISEETTYDWEIIKSIFSNCLIFAGGFYIISNVIVFIVLHEWYTDPIVLAATAVIFAFYHLQTFDKFYSRLMK